MALGLKTNKQHKEGAHEYRMASATDLDALLKVVAMEYVRLRAESILPLAAVQVDGIDVMDVTAVSQRLKQAVVPTTSKPGTPFDILRSDFGETLAYLILEQEYSTRIGYKGIRDRETINLPGRGIDTVGTENLAALALLLGEVKLSEEAKSPPQVVDASNDCLRAQHRAHLNDREITTNKLWNISRFVRDKATRDSLLAAAFLFENNHPLEIISCSLLIRTAGVHKDTDYGSFRKKPADYAPAGVRFWIVCIPVSAADLVIRWQTHVQAAMAVANGNA